MFAVDDDVWSTKCPELPIRLLVSKLTTDDALELGVLAGLLYGSDEKEVLELRGSENGNGASMAVDELPDRRLFVALKEG